MTTQPMPDHRSARRPLAGLRSTRVRAALALGAAASVAVTGTMAAWTDTATIGGVTIATGNVNLQVAEGTGAFAENIADSTVLDISGLLPGQSTAGIVKVQNTGTGPLQTTFTSAATSTGGTGGTLHNSLTVKVTADTSVTGTGTARTCAGTAIAGSGTSLNSTVVPAWSLPGGSAPRTFCVQVTLDAGAPTTVQNASTTATLTFNGTT